MVNKEYDEILAHVKQNARILADCKKHTDFESVRFGRYKCVSCNAEADANYVIGYRKGVSDADEVLNAINELYTNYYNTDQDSSLFSEEFYYAVGELLKSGTVPHDLKYLEKENS